MDASKALSLWTIVYVIALAATIVATVAVNVYSRRMAAEADSRVAQANAHAARAAAETSAAAVEREKQLEAAAEQARARQQELATAAEQLRQQNVNLQSRLEHERTESLQLQAKIAPRRLTQDQKEQLRVALGKLPSHSVRVLVFSGTEDGMPFSLDLVTAINAGGWQARHSGLYEGGGWLKGVALFVKDVNHLPVYAQMLQDTLKEIGIDAPAVDVPELVPTDDAVILFVAPKN
jgi:flagellar biosynthesis GTPase FlhF